MTVFVLSAPGAVVCIGLIYLAFRRLDGSVCLACFGGLILLQALLNAPWAYYWNRRAASLSSHARGES